MATVRKEDVGKLILLWIGINFVMTLTWTLQISYYYHLPFMQSFWPTLVRVYCISSLSPLFGTYMGHRLANRPIPVRFLFVIPASVIGAIAGVFLSEYLMTFLFKDLEKTLGENMYGYTLVSSIISSIFASIIAATISVLMEKNRNYEKRLQKIETDITTEFLTFKNRDVRSKVQIEKIMYLTSTGKHTILHTPDGDIEIPMLLKDVGAQLPSSHFVRVHKKHLVNVQRIGGLRHVHSGSYHVTLNDDDDSVIPVGRKYLSQIQTLFRKKTDFYAQV